MANEEAREAQMVAALEAIDWRTLTPVEMAAFILGAVDASEKAGIRQAREAVAGEERRLVDLWLGAEAEGASLSLRAIDALGEDDRG